MLQKNWKIYPTTALRGTQSLSALGRGVICTPCRILCRCSFRKNTHLEDSQSPSLFDTLEVVVFPLPLNFKTRTDTLSVLFSDQMPDVLAKPGA